MPPLPHGDFRGSLRIEPLDYPPGVRWARAIDATVDGALVQVIGSSACYPMDLTAVTAPFHRVHRELVGMRPAWPEFWLEAAQALVEIGWPIRVVVRDGRATRPEHVNMLARSTGRRAFRLEVDQRADTLLQHALKRGEDVTFEAVKGLRSFHLRREGFVRAMRLAARQESRDTGRLGGLLPDDWPAVEAFVALGLEAIRAAEHERTCALHAARDVCGPVPSGLLLAELQRLRGDVHGIRPGTEELYAALRGGLVGIAGHATHPDEPLRLSTSYGSDPAAAAAKLREQALRFEATPGFACVLES